MSRQHQYYTETNHTSTCKSSDPTTPHSNCMTSQQSQSQQGQFKRSPSCSSLSINASSSSNGGQAIHQHRNSATNTTTLKRTTSTGTSRRTGTNDGFDEQNPVIIHPSSPCGTPPRKRWEGAFNLFLRGKNQQQHSHSPTLSSSPCSSITSIPIADHDADEQSCSTSNSGSGKNGLKGTRKKSSFSLIPGSRRLVSRNSMNLKPSSSGLASMFSKRGSATAATVHANNASNDNSNHSRNSCSSNNSRGRLFSRGHKSMDELDVPLRKGMSIERAKTGSGSVENTDHSSPNSPNRRTSNLTRRRQQQEHNHIPYSSSVPDSTAIGLLHRGIQKVQQQSRQSEKKSGNVSSILSKQLMATTNATTNVTSSNTTRTLEHPSGMDNSIRKTVPIDWLVHPIVNEGVELPLSTVSAPSLTQLQPQPQSLTQQQSQSRSPYGGSNGCSNNIAQHEFDDDDNNNNIRLHMIPTLPPPALAISNHYRIPSSLTDYHDVGLNLDDSDHSHMDANEQQLLASPNSNSRTNNNSNINNVEPCGIPEPPESLDEILGEADIGGSVTVFSGSSSSYNNIFHQYHNNISHHNNQQQQRQQLEYLAASPETKKAFTKIHNSTEYGHGDSIVSPFLGGNNKASNLDLVGSVHNTYVSHYNNMLLNGRHQQHQQQQYYPGSISRCTTTIGTSTNIGTIDRQHEQHDSIHISGVKDNNSNSSTSLLSKSLPLETVDELQNSSIKNQGIRLLKPIQGAKSWMQGRRYLIAPAALASCPLSTIKSLTNSSTQSATKAATSYTCSSEANLSRTSDMIVLGEAHMTYVGDKYHLTYGKWSSCRLVLRQNYLFEYDLGTPLTSLPRGIAHLQHAAAYPHKDFQDALELHFYASPCAKVDHRVLMIRVTHREERDHWITCFNKAAKLQISDIWEFDGKNPIGTGRYASIYPAQRKQRQITEEGRCDDEKDDLFRNSNINNCALKIIDKNEFWRLVIKGRERCDTIVRELAVQSTLTATFGSKRNNFLRLRGFFETSDKIVIEMELLDGKDLFEYITSKGVLEEDEARHIIQDVLVGLLHMNQIGIAHRDIKPANIFVTNESKYGTSVKLGDFGMSTLVGLDGLVRGRCGSPGYVAPEVLMAKAGQGYGNQADIFSAGVTLYVMLCGYEPFYGKNESELIEANKLAEIDFPRSEWGKISPEARDLVEQMLKTDPVQRIHAKDALQHNWIIRSEQKHRNGHFEETTAKRENHEGICAIM